MSGASVKGQVGKQQMAKPDCAYEKAKERYVGSLNGKPVYFTGSRTSFKLVIEYSPGELRSLSEAELLRFRRQSRIEGLPYGRL